MPFVPVPDCVQCKIEGRIDGQQTINDLYFRSTTGPRSAADVQALSDAIAIWYGDTMAPLLNEGWSAVRVTSMGLSSPTPFVAESTMTGVVGGVSGEAAPNNCTMCVSFRTGLGGRSNRGRNYVPCLTNSQVVGNLIDAGWAADIVAGYNALVFPTSVLPSGWIWVVVSRVSGGVERVEGVFHEVFSCLVGDLIVDSMRTRLPGRGR